MPLATLDEFPAFDFVVCGETENILIPILDSDEALGKIKGLVIGGSTSITWSGTDNLDEIPFPVWEDFELSRYGGLYPHRTAP